MRMKIWTAVPLLILAAVVGCGSPEARKAEYTARAKQYMQDGNWPKARVALRNVLKIDPKDPDAYFMYAQVEEKEKNWQEAFGYYLRVVEINPDHRETLIQLGRYYLDAGMSDKVAEMADRVLKKYPGDAQAEILKAALMVRDGKVGEAIRATEDVLRLHPKEPDAASLLAALYARQQRPEEAEKILRRAVEANPNNIVLLSNLGNILVHLDKKDEAEPLFQRMVEVEPHVFEHRLRLAGFYEQYHELDKAETTLRKAIRLDPDNDQGWLGLAEFVTAHKGIKEGEAVLLEAIKKSGEAAKFQFALGQLYQKAHEPDEARKVYERIADDQEDRPQGLDARVKLAELDFAEGKRDAADKRLQEVLKKNTRSSDALLLEGKISLLDGEGRDAVQAFRSVLKDQPERADVHVLLGQAYLLAGEEHLGRESLEKGVALDGRQFDARRALARLDAAEGNREAARGRLEAILKELPNDIETLGMMLTLQMGDQEWRGAEATLTRIQAAGGDPFPGDMAEGNLGQARKQWERATKAYERAMSLRPDAPEPLFARMQVELAQGKKQEGIDRLRKLISAHPEQPYAHGMLGEILVLQKDQTGAEHEFLEGIRIKPDWVTPWIDLSNLKLLQARPSEAAQVLEKGLQANPKSEQLQVLLASAQTQIGQTDRAIQLYEKVLEKNPKALVAANNLASLLTERRGDSQSLDRALALSRDFEKNAPNPLFLDTLGWVYVKMGRVEDGVRVFQKIETRMPDRPILYYHLGMAYYKAGNEDKAKRYLAKAVHAARSFPGIEEARTTLAQIKG
ncbi:MAG TPA: tetratricopeptide repeat protein [Nitrospiria bacterium]|nr:tetratricopeptide repeat protein [Nitrospiria bacterium]